MKAKLLSLTILALFLVSMVSAFTINSSPTSIALSDSKLSDTFTITPNDENMSLVGDYPRTIYINDVNSKQVELKLTAPTNLTNLASAIFNISVVSIDPDFGLGIYDDTTFQINATNVSATISDIETITVSFTKSYCEIGDKGGDLDLDVDISNKEGYGDDEEWYLLDNIEVDINVDNRADEKINDIVVEWGLYNTRTGKFVIDDKEKQFNLKANSDKTITVSFTLDPKDFDESDDEDDFIFVAKAYSKEEGERVKCVSEIDYSISVLINQDFVVLNDIEIPETLQCGGQIEVTADIWNIGNDDQYDITVLIFNNELGINQEVEIGDIDALDNRKLSALINIPENAQEKEYDIIFAVYDEDGDVYENDNHDKAEVKQRIKIEGGKCAVVNSLDITASLESDAVAGKELVVKVLLTNTGDKQLVYTILLDGYGSWAKLEQLSESSLTINSGETKEITITLIPNQNAEGDNDFVLKALSGGEIVSEKTISVSITPYKSPFSGIIGGSISDIFKGNSVIWMIGIVNVVLILLIIIVAVKVAKKKE